MIDGLNKINQKIHEEIVKKFGYTKYIANVQEIFDNQSEMMNDYFNGFINDEEKSKRI